MTDYQDLVRRAAAARRCSWSIPEENHPDGNLCRMEGHCLDSARAMLDAAGVPELLAQHERLSASDDARVARLMSIVTPLGYAQALALLEAETAVECPHWSPGRITLRRACTACAAEATR